MGQLLSYKSIIKKEKEKEEVIVNYSLLLKLGKLLYTPGVR